jgi:polysaccharide deacetylase family protein (PEP-CTERM system associated)
LGITVTYDLEDHRSSSSQERRFGLMTERLLTVLAELRARATVFVVGELAQSYPELVRQIAAAGHEVGLHGWRHVTFRDVGRDALPEELRRGKNLLEETLGAPVQGLRAPIFSLTPSTAWAIDQIFEAGFRYSSSVLPSANPLNGWPGAPPAPFRWPNGLVELPCPVFGIGRLKLPFLGGVYLRHLPRGVVLAGIRRIDPSSAPWTYLHPYDFDYEEPFHVLPWAGWLTSRIVLSRRRETLARVRIVIEAAGGPGPPLAEIAACAAGAPVFAVY